MASKAPLGASSLKPKLQKSDLAINVQTTADVTDNPQNEPLSNSPPQVIGVINVIIIIKYFG